MPQPDPRAHLAELARQAQTRERTWPGGEDFAALAALRDQVRARFATHMALEYGIDVLDEEHARAVHATLEWVAETITNAMRLGSVEPLGVLIQGVVAATHVTAPTITGMETP